MHEDPMTKLNHEQILEELSYQAALAEADHGTSTRADDRWSRELGDKLQARLAQLRRNLLPASAPIQRAKPIRAKWLELARDQLLAALAALSTSDGVQYAHRDLQGLSDNDLRQLLDLLDTSPRE